MPLFNNIYRINWNRFAVLSIPNDLRKLIIVRYLLALFAPIKEAYNDFLLFRYQQLYEAEINGQTINLERVLNDIFDPIDRRIYITDGDYYEPPVFYEEWENKPVIFYDEGDTRNPVFWSTDDLNNRVSVNFYVHVPTGIFFESTRMRALVNKYKAFGRTFEIIII